MLVALLLSSPVAFAGDAIWKSYFKSGQQSLDAKNPDAAEKVFKSALAEARSDGTIEQQSQCLFALAQASMAKRDYDQALTYLGECGQLTEKTFGSSSPAVSAAREAMGEACELAGNLYDAEVNYKIASKIAKPDSLQEKRLLFKLSRVYQKQGKTAEAEALSQSAGSDGAASKLNISEYVACFSLMRSDHTSAPAASHPSPTVHPLPYVPPRSEQTSSTSNNSNNSTGRADFGPYMADLQRRLKRAWFPPRGLESKLVKVMFKVHRNGEMSHLRISTSSGFPLADQAALKACENGSPFRPLPPGSPDNVDIVFTFDYKAFSGGGAHGTFRQF